MRFPGERQKPLPETDKYDIAAYKDDYPSGEKE
jgi:hypothetical protein